MNTRLSQILIIVGALIAFLPVLAVDSLLDHYVRGRESNRIFNDIKSITNETQRAAYSGVASIRQIMNDSPSLCTPTFIANVQKQLQSNIYLKQVLVENYDGVQYCDGYGAAVVYSVLSRGLTIPGNSESISVVRFAGEKLPSLKVTQFVGANRTISGFVHISPRLGGGLPDNLSNAALLRLELTDGTEIITIGDPDLVDRHDDDGYYIHVHSFADALPLMTEIAVPFALVRAEYAGLGIAITVIAALMSAAFLVLAFHYVRQARLPAFDLERAIANGELKPYYQPLMDISSGRLAGCEVLIRWEKKDGKLVSPGVFIDYAEATGLAIPMTINLMKQVNEDLSDLCADMPNLKVAINLFAGHFQDTSIIEDVQAIFEDSPINYRQLVFEITERRPLENQLATNGVIGGLHALGCRIAMDDAGTGHSNLEYMQTLGIDIIKIDRMFIDMIEPESKNVPILDGLINMAADMGLDVVAEGVETEAQALYLRERGVFEAQGFLFAPALQCNSFIDLARALNGKPVRSKTDDDADETEATAPEADVSSDDAAA